MSPSPNRYVERFARTVERFARRVLRMELTRRQFVLAGIGAVAAGCATSTPMAAVPSPTWPGSRHRPKLDGGTLPWNPPPQRHAQNASPTGPVSVIPRSRWARGSPVLRRLNPLGGVSRITVHHEGHTDPVYFTDYRSSAERMELIRKWHLKRDFGDIGYHYVVDRGGRIWEGRSTRYQGAHVSKNNEGNLGVMVLGNFDLQTPSSAQIAVVNNLIPHLSRSHGVPIRRIYTHQELMPTTCPGNSLQSHMVDLRRHSELG